MPEFFENRRDPEYIKCLRKQLDIQQLIDTAIELPATHYGRTDEGEDHGPCTKRCDIWFVGLSADNFFDRNDSNNAWKQTQRLFTKEARERFRQESIWLRIRFLFLYPYSTHAMSIIKAETNVRRTAIDGPDRVHPSTQHNLQVSEDHFFGSSLYRHQKIALATLQEWLDESKTRNTPRNSIVVRFTPVSPNLCGLIINGTAYSDPYILAKKRRWSTQLELASPLVCLDHIKDKRAFEALQDHFRYLWQLSITLDSQDATSYIPVKPKPLASDEKQEEKSPASIKDSEEKSPRSFNEPEQDSLASIKRPQEIDFNHKASRLAGTRLRYRLVDEEHKAQWITRTRKQFLRYVTEPAQDSPNEQVFISCCWEIDGVSRRRSPNVLAKYIRDWLRDDITKKGKTTFKVQILEGENGDNLQQRLYGMMESSVLGLVLLTAAHYRSPIGDVPGQRSGTSLLVEPPSAAPPWDTKSVDYVASTNVYHELGYLMSLLERESASETKRVFVCAQRDVQVPTNIGHRIRETIDPLTDDDREAVKESARKQYKHRAGESNAADDGSGATPSHNEHFDADYFRIGRELISWYLYFSVLDWLNRASTLAKSSPEIIANALDSHNDRIKEIAAGNVELEKRMHDRWTENNRHLRNPSQEP